MQICIARLRFNMGWSRVTNCWHFVISETPDVIKPRNPGPNVTKDVIALQEKPSTMQLALKHRPVELKIVASAPVDREIRDFIAGRNDGEDLLHALYDHVLDEPVPERLRALLKP